LGFSIDRLSGNIARYGFEACRGMIRIQVEDLE
jgi:hypothetical protein